MKYIGFLLAILLCGCRTAPSDPFATGATATKHLPLVERTVLTLNQNGPPLRPDETPSDYEKQTENEWRSITEQGLLKFFEKEGVSFISTPGSYIFVPKPQPQFMRNANHKYYIVIVQTNANLKKIKEIQKRYE